MIQPWIRLSKNNNEAVKMFCFPFSGASAQSYLPFANLQNAGVNVHALEMPGRGRRFQEEMFGDMSAIVDEAATGLEPFIAARDFVFFGHSLGGLIAFEVARELRRRDKHLPMHFFISGMLAPQIPRKRKTVSDLSDTEFLERVKELEGTPDEILDNPEMLELMIPLLRNDFKIYENYRYADEEQLKCPITAFAGTEDKFVDADDVQKWSEQTAILFSKHVFDGGHFYIYSHLEEIFGIINRTLTMHRLW